MKTSIEARKAALRAQIEKLKRENAVLEKQIDRRTDAEKIAAIFLSAWDKAVAMANQAA